MSQYSAFYGLPCDPFSKGSRSVVQIETEEFKEIIYRLNYLKDLRGVGVLLGEPGCGKTIALKQWASSLPSSGYKVIYTTITNISVGEFYKYLAEELGLEVSFRKSANFRNIKQEIRRLTEEKATIPVFLLDEASELLPSVLDELKSLLNFDMDSRNKAILILCGTPVLGRILSTHRHEALHQRIVMNCIVQPLSEQSAVEYVKNKLKAVNGSPDLFTPEALTAVSSASKGIPRIIDKICSRCLILGSQTRDEYINANTVMLAVEDMEIR